MARQNQRTFEVEIGRKLADGSARSPVDRVYVEEILRDLSESAVLLDGNVVKRVHEESNLPSAEAGTRQLEDNRVYMFEGFISSADTLELGTNTVLVAPHGGVGGFIHTGGTVAIRGRGENFFARDMLLSAPGGTVLDIEGTASEEILVESVSLADPAGLGDMASLGTITGFRVPSFKGCNFEDFSSGLTFSGSPEKVLMTNSPFRGVTASSVTVLTFDSGFSTEVVQLLDNYAKTSQPDTKIVDYQGTLPTQVFQYINNSHDPTITTSNILNGKVGVGVVGVRVSNSFPLADSITAGVVTLDNEATTPISTQDSYVQVNGASTLGAAERTTGGTGAVITVDSKRREKVMIDWVASWTGKNGETYEFAIFKNGSIIPETEIRVDGEGPSTSQTSTVGHIEEVGPGDKISMRVRNKDATSDITFTNYSLELATA